MVVSEPLAKTTTEAHDDERELEMPSSQRKTSRPTTPLRRIERGSLSALSQSRSGADDASFPLDSLDVAFAELSDSFSDFAANMQQIVELGQGISSFNESFASFLYGLKVNAFCVDFTEVRYANVSSFVATTNDQIPIAESFKRYAERQTTWQQDYNRNGANQPETTFLTTDDSFVERPPPRQSLDRSATTKGTASRGRGRASARQASGFR